MELDDSSRYALGALFTLALHGDELRAGSEANHSSSGSWGQHEEQIIVTTEEDSDEAQNVMAARWDAFWGFDHVSKGGLLDRVFTKLEIDRNSWPGLKQLPQVAESSGYSELVAQYRGVLDRELTAQPLPKFSVDPPLNQVSEVKNEALAAGQVEADDEDLAGDLQRAKFRSSAQLKGLKTESESSKAKSAASGLNPGAQRDREQDEGSSPAQDVGAQRQQNDDSKSASELASSPPTEGLSPAAFTAATQLLEACIANQDMPKLDDIVETDAKGKTTSKANKIVNLRGSSLPANVRWYDSRARQALRLVTLWLNLPWSKILLYECLIVQQAQAPDKKGDGKKQMTATEKRMRALKIGAAAAGGGAILALTGGLAAPALIAVGGAVLPGAAGLLGSSVGAAAIVAGFGAGGAKVVGGKMAHRIGEVKEFGFREIPDDHNYRSTFSAAIPSPGDANKQPSGVPGTPSGKPSTPGTPSGKPNEGQAKGEEQQSSWFGSDSKKWLPWSKSPEPEAVPLLPVPVSTRPRADPKLTRTIAVAGWIAEPDDFVNMWRGLSCAESERFTLVWETKELIELKNSMINMLMDQAYQQAGKYLIEHFVIHGLVAAVALPLTVVSASGMIDSSWAVVMNRAARAGELLAHLLMSGAHGDMPVVLVGNSMGARLIFHCLLELCRCKCKGIVQDAIMLGTPVDVIPERWVMARSVVSGRCVNGYSKKDWVLALSFRAKQATFRPAAGLGIVPVPGIENVDLTALVNGHGDYINQMDAVLEKLDLAQPSSQSS